MSTIIIELPDRPSGRFKIDLAKESEEFAEEVKKFVTKLEARALIVKKNGSKRLSPNLKQARQYIDVLSRRPESRAALAEANKRRKDWIRKNGWGRTRFCLGYDLYLYTQNRKHFEFIPGLRVI